MVGTRSRTYSNNVVLKRKYTKRKTVQSNQNDPSEFHHRVVSRNRVISSEDEIVVEKKPKEYKNSLKGAYIFLYLLIYCLFN
jgi:hypothetical protein